MASCAKKGDSLLDTNQAEFMAKTDTPNTGGNTIQNYLFAMDGVIVHEDEFSVSELGYNVVTIDSLGTATWWSFSSKSDFFDFGDDHEIPLRKIFQASAHLAQYAEDNGYIAEYDSTGSVSQSFMDYQESYIATNFPELLAKQIWPMPTMLHKDCVGGSSWPSLAGFTPFMAPGWNNKVSRLFLFNIYGFNAIYDRVFYDKHIVTVRGWGWQNICLTGHPLWDPADDKMSSCFSW